MFANNECETGEKRRREGGNTKKRKIKMGVGEGQGWGVGAGEMRTVYIEELILLKNQPFIKQTKQYTHTIS